MPATYAAHMSTELDFMNMKTGSPWQPDRPWNNLPLLPPEQVVELLLVSVSQEEERTGAGQQQGTGQQEAFHKRECEGDDEKRAQKRQARRPERPPERAGMYADRLAGRGKNAGGPVLILAKPGQKLLPPAHNPYQAVG